MAHTYVNKNEDQQEGFARKIFVGLYNRKTIKQLRRYRYFCVYCVVLEQLFKCASLATLRSVFWEIQLIHEL